MVVEVLELQISLDFELLMRISYNFGDLISCLRVHMPPMFVQCPHSNDGALLFAGKIMLGYWEIGESILSGEEFEFESDLSFLRPFPWACQV